MEITIFKDIKETSQPFYRDVNIILDRIRDGASKDIIKRIRSEKDKEKIIKATTKYSVAKGTIDKFATYGDVNEVMDAVKPVVALKNVEIIKG